MTVVSPIQRNVRSCLTGEAERTSIMCHFVSWIHEKKGTVNRIWFLTDKDVMDAEGTKDPSLISWYDYVGHHAIEKLFGVKGLHKELDKYVGYKRPGERGVPMRIPAVVAKAIRAGKMNLLMKAGGYTIFKVDKYGAVRHTKCTGLEIYNDNHGWNHRTDGPAYISGGGPGLCLIHGETAVSINGKVSPLMPRARK